MLHGHEHYQVIWVWSLTLKLITSRCVFLPTPPPQKINGQLHCIQRISSICRRSRHWNGIAGLWKVGSPKSLHRTPWQARRLDNDGSSLDMWEFDLTVGNSPRYTRYACICTYWNRQRETISVNVPNTDFLRKGATKNEGQNLEQNTTNSQQPIQKNPKQGHLCSLFLFKDLTPVEGWSWLKTGRTRMVRRFHFDIVFGCSTCFFWKKFPPNLWQQCSLFVDSLFGIHWTDQVADQQSEAGTSLPET